MEWSVLVVALAASAGAARITDCRITDYIGFKFTGTRRITDCRVVAVVVIIVGGSASISSRNGADYGLWDYGFVRIEDCVRISCWHGLQDYGLF